MNELTRCRRLIYAARATRDKEIAQRLCDEARHILRVMDLTRGLPRHPCRLFRPQV